MKRTTATTGINARGEVVGWYEEDDGTHGYLLERGIFTTIDFSGSENTELWDIHSRGYSKSSATIARPQAFMGFYTIGANSTLSM
jgi:hypothetical protein